MKPELYGHSIVRSPRISLAEQVYDIFCQEIHAERWEIGERLPSISSLADQCGISSRPIHQAFERLRKEGYLRAEKGSGTYLDAILPQGAASLGAIGILMARHDESQMADAYEEMDHWRMHAIIEEAARRNYSEQVKYLPRDHDGQGIDSVGGLFDSHVKGIISLHNFPRKDCTELSGDQIPFVYLGSTGFTGRPKVSLDIENGFYRLTKRVIAEGHESIVCIGPEPGAREADARAVFAGHEQAMTEAGLPVNHEAYLASRIIVRGDWVAYRTYLEKFGQAATAFICTKSHRAMDVIAVADMLHLRVPEDLSVTGFSCPMRAARPDQRLTGIDYNLKHTVHECFDLLFKQIRTRRSDVSLVQVKPLICEGDSLAEPRRHKQRAAFKQSGVDRV